MQISGCLARVRSHWQKKLLTSFIIFSLPLLLLACSKTDKSGKMPMSAMPMPAVDVYKVPLPKSIPVKLEYPARIKSSSSVTIVARVTGTLQKKSFLEGQAVREGETLFKIEPDLYLAEKAHAEAQLEQAAALLNKAEKDWQRTKVLYEQHVANEQDRDAVRAATEMAKASVAAAKARLHQATINLDYTDVKATGSGITGLKLVDVGNLVNPGMPLVTLTQMDPIYVEFSLPDLDALKTKYELKSGSWSKSGGQLRARLLTDKGPYRRLGRVDFLDTNIDEKTASVKSRAIFANPDGELLPGQFIRIALEGVSRKNVLTIPQQALIQNPAGAMVFVVEGGKVTVRPVVIGDSAGENFIIEKGLKPGDLVVVNNFFKIKPNSPVKTDKIINKGA